MNHAFNIEVAKIVGVNAAVILENFAIWWKTNKAKKRNFHDGDYWTYNTMKGLAELFPYMNERQIRYAIDKLREAGFIKEGNYNASAYDRTKWYSLTEKAKDIYVTSISQDCQIEVTKLSNGSDTIVEPIPDINTDIKPDKNITPLISPQQKLEDSVVTRIFEHWKKVMKSPWSKMSDKRRSLIRKWLKTYSPDELIQAVTGCSLTAHNMGDNDRGQRYNSIELILRDAEHIERFMANAINPPKKKGGSFSDYFSKRGITYERDITPDPLLLG